MKDKQVTFSESSIWRLVSNRSQEIVAITGGANRPAFYCIHSVAGDITGYFELARLLGPQIAFYGIQVPKGNMSADAVVSIEVLGRRYADLLNAFQPEGPFIVGGFSAGAIIALETAQQLTCLGREVRLLVALDGAPSNVEAGIKTWSLSYFDRLFRNAIRCFGDFHFDRISIIWILSRLTERIVCKSALRIPLSRSGKTLDVASMLTPLARPGWRLEYKLFMRAMYEAMYTYVPAAYNGRVLLYELERQPLFHLRQLEAVWSKLAKECECVKLKGRHGEFFQPLTLLPLVDHLKEALLAEQRLPLLSYV